MNRKQRRAGAAVANQSANVFVETFNKALELQRAGQLEKAEALYRRAMTMNPNLALLYSNLGVVVYSQGRTLESIPIYKKAISLDPTLSLAHNNLGVALSALSRLDEALEAFGKAIAIVPDDPEPTNNYGDCLVKLSRFAEGAQYLRLALKLKPNYVEALTNLGTALWGLGQLDEAVAHFHRAIELQPDVAMAHKNLGIVLLLMGRFKEGWREYDWRWLADKIILRPCDQPIWKGNQLGDKKLLVWAEQGVGDEILHAGMMDDLVKRGFKVVWEVDERLVKLLQRSNPSMTVVGRRLPPAPETEASDIAANIPAGSIGQHLRLSYDDFPKDRRSYLVPDKERSAAFRASLNLKPGEKLVGMSWLSKNLNFGKSKSTQLADWAGILATPGLKFVDLQYGDTEAERKALQEKFGITLAHVDGLDLKDDLDGVAALVAACDLVVTVSNSTAHFAGGLGVPVWIMIAAGVGKFWYWGFNTATVPWYPSATLIRQNEQQDWGPTLTEVAERLKKYATSE